MPFFKKTVNLFNILPIGNSRILYNDDNLQGHPAGGQEPAANGVLLFVSVTLFPFTISPITGIATNAQIKFYLDDLLGTELLGTDQANGHMLSVDFRETFIWVNPYRLSLLSSSPIMEEMQTPGGAAGFPDIAVFDNQVRIHMFGDNVTNPQNANVQIEVMTVFKPSGDRS